MATAHSRSPQYVRGGRLHALEKLFVAHSIRRQEDTTPKLFFARVLLACRALGRFERGRVGLLVQGLLPRQAGDGPPKAAKV